MKHLKGRRVALLVTDGFEQSELSEPKRALEDAGAQVDIVSPKNGDVRGWTHTEWGDRFSVDVPLAEARVEDYDALVLPGGQMNPDVLRANEDAVNFVRQFVQSGKVVAAICHGPWMLVEAEVVRGKVMTSYKSIRTDLRNAGAEWVDKEVVVDGNIITSRQPDDLPAFNTAIIERLHASAATA